MVGNRSAVMMGWRPLQQIGLTGGRIEPKRGGDHGGSRHYSSVTVIGGEGKMIALGRRRQAASISGNAAAEGDVGGGEGWW